MVWRRSSTTNTPEGGEKRVHVVDPQGRRPFMRGIMVHSLMARGVDFELAYQTADRVRDEIRGRAEVPRAELAQLVAQLMGGGAAGSPAASVPLPAPIEVGGGDRAVPFSKG